MTKINPKSNTQELRLFLVVLSYSALWDFILSTQHLGLVVAHPHTVQWQWISLREIGSHYTSDVSLVLSHILIIHSTDMPHLHQVPVPLGHSAPILLFLFCFEIYLDKSEILSSARLSLLRSLTEAFFTAAWAVLPGSNFISPLTLAMCPTIAFSLLESLVWNWMNMEWNSHIYDIFGLRFYE